MDEAVTLGRPRPGWLVDEVWSPVVLGRAGDFRGGTRGVQSSSRGLGPLRRNAKAGTMDGDKRRLRPAQGRGGS